MDRKESVIMFAHDDQQMISAMHSPVSSPVVKQQYSSRQSLDQHVLSIDVEALPREPDSESSLYDGYSYIGGTSSVHMSPVSEDHHQLRDSSHFLSAQSSCAEPFTTPVGRKRGRPKLDQLNPSMEISFDSENDNAIRCGICKRTFPREKSLQAHIRIHTGERPYQCDFPDCGRRFAQSGQLRTHQRLHTGEKPFVCNANGCMNRFTHANRHCSIHPEVGVRRDKSQASGNILKVNTSDNTNDEIINWLKEYYAPSRRTGGRNLISSESKLSKACKLEKELEVAEAAERLQSTVAKVLDLSGGVKRPISDEDDDGDEKWNEENSAPIWKKKRAALEWKAKKVKREPIDHISLVTPETPIQDQKDHLLGAIALMELSGHSIVTAPNVQVKTESLATH